ncbi:HD domain-containing protein [Clostridium cellulovorans]|uniref:Metal dependent phosphohydrolase n=1 Tax=Clostridium cellulovorans (strain ATCC 35296 / DSM 3052 / OCM 3 / 743B) TaxID=573061 RepID=D9SKC5_CLOC7|nr:HD domain-containing protein [Clostridium cellulovorans]ADL51421.1 metal dependent phosphohydrolase [Clostridium cellulovorans 743B]
MEVVNEILENSLYKEALKRNNTYEENRIFCKHNLEHFLDVARIAYIIVLENNLDYKKEIIYAVALLHDIGRYKQYEANIPHDIASVELADIILKNIGFSEAEKEKILSCIKNHRNSSNERFSLEEIIYIADKKSRSCYNCSAIELCNWTKEKKNLCIIY